VTNTEETPLFGTKLDTEYIPGLVKMKDSFKNLLKIDLVLGREEVATFVEQF
jgi:hypothetical protein